MSPPTWTFVLAALAVGVAIGLVLRPWLSEGGAGRAFRRSPPFAVGDGIVVRPADGGAPLHGVVESIDSTATTLVSPQGQALHVPHRLAGRAMIETYRLAVPGTEHTLDLRLAGSDDDRKRHAAALDAALTHLWADGLTPGPQPPRWQVQQIEGAEIVYRITYAVAPRRHPEAAVRHALLARLHRHMLHAGLVLAADGRAPCPPIDTRNPADRAACLARTRLFDELPAEERLTLAEALIPRWEEGGQPIVREGLPGSTIFVVAAGVLEVCVGASRTEPAQRVNTIGPGEFFGEMATLTGAPRSTTVVTLTPALLLEISPAVLSPLLRRNQALADGLSRAMSEHLRRDAERAGGAAVVPAATAPGPSAPRPPAAAP